MPLSIWPVAILAAIAMAACRLVPQACCMVMPGVVGASLVPSTASRARFQSLECDDDGAADHLVDVHALQLVLVDQAVQHAVSISRLD